MTLPNFIGLGVQKAATTWLHSQLQSHPEIYVPNLRKEVHYFDWYHDKGLGWYEKFFPNEDEKDRYKAIGEITPGYFYYPQVIKYIYEEISNPKFLLILRDPVDRLYSQYRMDYSQGSTSLSLDEYVKEKPDAYERGLYSVQLKHYLNFFSIDNVLILVYEDIFKDHQSIATTLRKIAVHLEVSSDLFDLKDCADPVGESASSGRPLFWRGYRLAMQVRRWLMHRNMEGIVRVVKILGISKRIFGKDISLPKMDTESRKYWQQKYIADIHDLEAIVGREFPEWKK